MFHDTNHGLLRCFVLPEHLQVKITIQGLKRRRSEEASNQQEDLKEDLPSDSKKQREEQPSESNPELQKIRQTILENLGHEIIRITEEMKLDPTKRNEKVKSIEDVLRVMEVSKTVIRSLTLYTHFTSRVRKVWWSGGPRPVKIMSDP